MEKVNINKYFILLESLKFPTNTKLSSNNNNKNANNVVDSNGANNKEIFQYNLNILEKHLKEDIQTIWKSNVSTLQLDDKFFDGIDFTENTQWKYIAYLQHVMITLIKNINFNSDSKEDLISAKHMNYCIQVAQELGEYGLRLQLHPAFYNDGSMFKLMLPDDSLVTTNYQLLYITIEIFHHLLKITQFHMANSMEFVIRDYIAGIFSLVLAFEQQETSITLEEMKTMNTKLDSLWCDFLKVHFFRNLLLLKGIPGLPVPLQKALQEELLRRLRSEDGFATLVSTIQSSWEASKQQDRTGNLIGDSACCEVIAKIVAHKGHKRSHQRKMITEVNNYLNICMRNELRLETLSAGLLTLRRLYDLNEENKEIIERILDADLKALTLPEDVLSGLIIMDHKEFSFLILRFYEMFCSSFVECLPSQILIKFLPLWLQLNYYILEDFTQKQQINNLILRCLNNREDSELETIIERIYKRILHRSWFKLHPRILVVCDSDQKELVVKIVSSSNAEEAETLLNLPTTLTDILVSSQNSVLIYRVFMALLKLMAKILLLKPATDATHRNMELLESEDDVVNYLNLNYPARFDILVNLNRLIEHQALRNQIHEHSKDFLKFLQWLLDERLKCQSQENEESFEQILLIILALCQEFMGQSQNAEQYSHFIPTFQRLKQSSSNSLIDERTNLLIALINGDTRNQNKSNPKAFDEARTLLESPETHLRVYGIQMALDLLKKRDMTTMASGHIIIGLALNILKSKDSYAFLNCVRLFVGLINVMESEVLELLAGEYHNECAELDYRLVVGETILKVCQEMGPMTYKYKDVLLNCFMHGARSSCDEFRMSSFANLAQLCRILCYQVQNFFQELLTLIDCELSTGQYIPSKRSAMLVLSELLEGMDNLLEFEEMLLPIYRILKAIESNTNCDDKMRLHAANGLKAINEKCKKLLFPEQQLQKEIRIFGIKDEATKQKKSGHILELN